MDWEMIILSEVRYTEKDKYQISLKCEIYDMTQMNIMYETEACSWT